jgi:hypothetical protein
MGAARHESAVNAHDDAFCHDRRGITSRWLVLLSAGRKDLRGHYLTSADERHGYSNRKRIEALPHR